MKALAFAEYSFMYYVMALFTTSLSAIPYSRRMNFCCRILDDSKFQIPDSRSPIQEVMATINRFEELDVWKLVLENASLIYDLSAKGDFAKDFALRDQIRRCAISVFSNIAEGFERDGNKEFINFLAIAKG